MCDCVVEVGVGNWDDVAKLVCGFGSEGIPVVYFCCRFEGVVVAVVRGGDLAM